MGEESGGIKCTSSGENKSIPKIVHAYHFLLRIMLNKILKIPQLFETFSTHKAKLDNEKFVITRSTNVLPISVADDFQTGNTLGSHSDTNKLCGVYISFPFLPPHCQTSLYSIFYALLFYFKDRTKFGNNAVFRKLIDELKHLETEGVQLDLPDKRIIVYFKLGVIIGDNLGLRSVLSFTESFNANYACRFCKMDKIKDR